MTTSALSVEQSTVNPVPLDEQRGSVMGQAVFWLGGETNVFNVVLGGVLVTFLLRTLWWALLAIAVGTGLGAALIALHATQGPRLRVPQMIQSRAQFGFGGASFLFAATIVLNVGFIAAGFVIFGQALNLVAGLPIPVWILIAVAPAALIGVYGYRWVHWGAQATAVLGGGAIIAVFIQALIYGHLPAAELTSAVTTNVHRPG
jgi:purine-cytosine permease-like protein